jgi:hypothetical protein
MSDTARHGAPQPDTVGVRHTLSVREVEALLAQAGVQRSHRHVLRMCASGMLDAIKAPGGSGDEWLVAPASVPKAIGDLKQIDARRARHGAPQPATSGHVVAETALGSNTDTAGHGAPQPAMAGSPNKEMEGETQPAMARYVVLLENDNEFLRDQVSRKDEQIADLSKRFGETQTLLGAMQRMLAPLLGQADPFTSPKREADVPSTGPSPSTVDSEVA